MCVDEEHISRELLRGLDGIEAEFVGLLASAKRSADPEAIAQAERACASMRYVLHSEAGSWKQTFANSVFPPDCNEKGLLPSRRLRSGRGMRLADFMQSSEAKEAGLSLLQVAALRIYTTAAFHSINEPLRDMKRKARGEAHPLPLTTSLLEKAVGKLRAVGATGRASHASIDLWRGLRNVTVASDFLDTGGTELGPMSTTSDLHVALQYMGVNDTSKNLLLKVRTESNMERGANLQWVSCFPAECEYLYRPLTYLQPEGQAQSITIAGRTVAVVTVTPRS
jgi:hypothetical protein